jgi:hypothetical protein
MTMPWVSLDVFEKNLKALSTLPAGFKLGAPDDEGRFKVSAGRSGRHDCDSITEVAPLLQRFLQLAALVAECDSTNIADPFAAGTYRMVQTTGLPNLLASYRKDGFFSSKANQRRAVEDVIDLALRAPQRARYWLIGMREKAFRRVRDLYQGRNVFSGEETFKSANKRYVAIAGGKYPAAGPATNSVKAMTLAQRESMRVRAGSEIGKDRHLTR